jgi:hypothetical protein
MATRQGTRLTISYTPTADPMDVPMTMFIRRCVRSLSSLNTGKSWSQDKEMIVRRVLNAIEWVGNHTFWAQLV